MITYRYIRDNATATEGFGRAYKDEVPKFLINRPASFIKHCMSKMDVAESILPRDVKKLSSNSYQVFLPLYLGHCYNMQIVIKLQMTPPC